MFVPLRRSFFARCASFCARLIPRIRNLTRIQSLFLSFLSPPLSLSLFLSGTREAFRLIFRQTLARATLWCSRNAIKMENLPRSQKRCGKYTGLLARLYKNLRSTSNRLLRRSRCICDFSEIHLEMRRFLTYCLSFSTSLAVYICVAFVGTRTSSKSVTVY